MEILLAVVAVVVVLVVVVVALAAGKPDEMAIQRTAHLDAPPERVYDLVNDFHEWPKWSPWEELDPAMQRTHSGSQNGVGAVYEWSGNKKVGQGRMEIIESTPCEEVIVDLHFLKPWEARNVTTFTLTPVNGDTELRWRMTAKRPLMMKIMGLFMDLDNMVGKDFDKGLANLKRVVTGDRDRARSA